MIPAQLNANMCKRQIDLKLICRKEDKSNYSLKSSALKSVLSLFFRLTIFLNISYSNFPQSGVELSNSFLRKRQYIVFSFPSAGSACRHRAQILFMSSEYIICVPPFQHINIQLNRVFKLFLCIF